MKMNNIAKKRRENDTVKKIIVWVMKRAKGITGILIMVVVFNIVLSLVPPQLLKLIVDGYLSTQKADGLYQIAALYLIVLILIGMFDFMKESLLTILGQKITRRTRESMMKKMGKIPGGYFSANDTGAIVSRFMNDVDSISALFTNGIVGMIIDICKILGIIVSIWIFSARLALIVFCLIPVIYGITRMFQKRMLAAQLLNRKHIARVNNHIPESLNNIQMIHSFHKEKYMEEKYKEYLKDSFEAVEKVNFYDSVFSPIVLVIRAVVIAVVVILCSDGLQVLGISIGMVAAAIELISNIFSPIETLGMELQGIQEAVAGIRRVDEFLAEEEEPEKIKGFLIEDTIKNKNLISVEFKNVTFGYPESTPILENISMKILNNENVIVEGRTGAGKSTLFKLILGIIQPDSGRVQICGMDTATIPNSEKRKLFGYVQQKFNFVYGTVADQITLGDESVGMEAVINALKFVGLSDYVSGLENGMQTTASENLFSKGQQQLLSIARAIVMNPPILLLDEMTANLDSETERKIISILQEAGSDRMLISISHRFSKVMECDKKMTIENRRLELEIK